MLSSVNAVLAEARSAAWSICGNRASEALFALRLGLKWTHGALVVSSPYRYEDAAGKVGLESRHTVVPTQILSSLRIRAAAVSSVGTGRFHLRVAIRRSRLLDECPARAIAVHITVGITGNIAIGVTRTWRSVGRNASIGTAIAVSRA